MNNHNPSLINTLARVPNGPLYGTLVVAFDQQIAGSLAAEELARAGATVVKVEKANEGDPKRKNSPPTAFNTFNAGKFSIAFEDTEDDQALKLALLRKADVIIDNRSEAAQQRDKQLQMTLREPRIQPVIYCAISGFGPGTHIPAYDRVVQATSGMAHLNGNLIAFPVIDMATGKEAAKDIGFNLLWVKQMAPEEKARLNCIRLDVSMAAVAMSMMSNPFAIHLDTGETRSSLVPFDLYPTRSSLISIAAVKDDQYQRLCKALEVPNIAKYRTNTERQEHREEVEQALKAALLTKTCEEWVALLESQNVPAQAVLDFPTATKRFGAEMVQLDTSNHAYVGSATISNIFPRNARMGTAPSLNQDKAAISELIKRLTEASEPQALATLLKTAHREVEKEDTGFYGKYKFVDLRDIDFTQEACNLSWAKGPFFLVSKVGRVKAERAKAGEVISTQHGGQEVTKNIAQEGDWKITSGQHDQYFISDKKFRQYYQPTPDRNGNYIPITKPMWAVKVTEDIQCQAPWGKVQYIPKGGLIVYRGKGDVYGIHPDNTDNFIQCDWVTRESLSIRNKGPAIL